MRIVIVTAIVASCLAGAALAQSNAADAQGFEYERRAGAEFSRRYPQAALDRQLPGAAVICCRVNEQRRFECETAFEWPQGYGFGDATVSVAEDHRLTQASYDRLMASPQRDVPFRRMMRWVLPGSMTPETTAALDRINEETQNICTSPMTEPVS